jgi:hypothetical protein
VRIMRSLMRIEAPEPLNESAVHRTRRVTWIWHPTSPMTCASSRSSDRTSVTGGPSPYLRLRRACSAQCGSSRPAAATLR